MPRIIKNKEDDIMADLKEINVDFSRDFFYECIEDTCKKFIKSYKEFKKGHNSFDEVEILHYLGELNRTTQMFEEEGQKEDEKLKEYYKRRKERYGY